MRTICSFIVASLLVASAAGADTLSAILEAQPDDVQARYQYRHPAETLEFFGIEPGMMVVEGLPGGGWYSKLLLQYLGEDGLLIGGSYAAEMYPLFSWASDSYIEKQKIWVETWTVDATGWSGDTGASVRAFQFGTMPEDIKGTADAVLFARVLHNLARFENEGKGDYLSIALADAYASLKAGGIFGVVQHHARDDMPDDWANGAHGYLKKSYVIAQAEAAGFEFVGEIDINANELDQPTTSEVVWRLLPGADGAEDDPERMAELRRIGESNRMTLKFIKPE